MNNEKDSENRAGNFINKQCFVGMAAKSIPFIKFQLSNKRTRFTEAKQFAKLNGIRRQVAIPY